MIKAVKLLVLVLLATVICGAGALAETVSGPVSFSVSASAEYSDNRDSVEDGESNVDLFLSPEVEAILDWETGSLDFEYVPTFRNRTNPNDVQNDNQLFHDLSLRVDQHLTARLKGRLWERFNVSDDPSIQEGGATLRRDASFTLNRLEGGLDWELNRLTHLDLLARHTTKQYDESVVAQDSDQSGMNVALTLWRQLNRTVGIMGILENGNFDYESSIGLERGFDYFYGLVGFEKVMGKQLKGGGRLGFETVSYEDDQMSDETSPFVYAMVEVTTIPTTCLTAELAHRIKDADVYPFSSQRFTDLHAKLSWDPPSELLFRVGTGYRVGEYDADVAPSSAPSTAFTKEDNGVENTFYVTGEVVYSIDDDMSLTLRQVIENVDSEVDISYTRNATRLVLSRDF